MRFFLNLLFISFFSTILFANDVDTALKLKKEGKSQEAIETLDNLCKKDNPRACYFKGVFYFKGDGLEQSYQKAIALFIKSCDLNDEYACANLAIINKEGIGIPKNRNNAINFYQKACKLGNKLACENYDHLVKQ